eukprot:symbB.v1.2.029593.t1/scaffold3261.1/size60078/1
MLQINIALPNGHAELLSLLPSSTIQDVRTAAEKAFGHKCLRLITAKNQVLVNIEQTLEEAEIEDGECLTALVLKPKLAATGKAFALWCHGDSAIVTWGGAEDGGDSSAVRDQLRGVHQIQATNHAFAAILEDGSVVTWGSASWGGDSSAVRDQLRGVQQIQATVRAFAAILADGSVVTWGDPDCGGDSSEVRDQLKGVRQIQATASAFAAILEDGSVVSWGYEGYGGNSSAVRDQLRRVQEIQGTETAFAAIRADGSVVTWGDGRSGGDSSAVQHELRFGHVQSMYGSSALRSTLGQGAGLRSWTSGELINRSLKEGQLPGAQALATPPRVFELGTFVKPRRWTELVQRSPPLEGLVKAGIVKRVDSVENADLCYWDAQEGDRLDHWLEAVVELCADMQVPLLQPKWGAAALDAMAPLMDATGTLESVALKMKRLGGRVLSCGKLDGAMEALDLECTSRDVLLVTSQLGDLIEASQQGADVLLLLGAGVKEQLRTWREVEARHETQRRKTMSVSQRVAEDSPRMMAAANNPFLSVFQLPSLLAEATASNRKHREMKERERSKATVAPTAPTMPADGAQEQKLEEKVADDVNELLERWCKAAKIPLPVAMMSSSTLLWDGPEKETPAPRATPLRVDAKPSHQPRAAADPVAGAGGGQASKANSKDIPSARFVGPGMRTEVALEATTSQWDASQCSSEDLLWRSCSHESVVMLGGCCGPRILPFYGDVFFEPVLMNPVDLAVGHGCPSELRRATGVGHLSALPWSAV